MLLGEDFGVGKWYFGEPRGEETRRRVSRGGRCPGGGEQTPSQRASLGSPSAPETGCKVQLFLGYLAWLSRGAS